jgi:NTE family protein
MVDMNNTNQEINEIIEKQEQKIDFIAFSGGGAKGAIYSGAYEELLNSGIWNGVNAVAGSSAGAITAALAASGIEPQEFERISRDTNLKGLLGKGTLGTNHDAIPLYDLMHTTIKDNLKNYINNNDVIQISAKKLYELNEKLTTLNAQDHEKEREKYEKMRDKLQNFIDQDQITELNTRLNDTGKVFFKDLDILSILDPSKFKGLSITATRKNDAALVLFNADNYPDVEIAEATRASASIPIVFKPMVINGIEYVDGGCRDNIPQTYFDNPEAAKANIEKDQKQIEADSTEIQEIHSKEAMAQAKKEKRVLAMAFGKNDRSSKAHMAIYSNKDMSPGFLSRFVDRIIRLVTKIGVKAEKGQEFNYSQDDAKTYEQLRKNALNTVILDTKSVGTLSFKEAQDNAEYLHEKGILTARRHFANFDLGQKQDPNLDMKEFLLSVYEKANFEQKSSWVAKTDIKAAEKNAQLFSAIKDERWNQEQPGVIIKDFVLTAAMERKHNGNFSVETKTMDNLIKLLNDPQTPNTVKNNFGNLFEPPKNTNVKYVKFSKDDFNSFIAKNAPAQESGKGKTALDRLNAQRENQAQNIGQIKGA